MLKRNKAVFQPASGKRCEARAQNQAVHSQARQQEDVQIADTWKQERRSDSSDSTSVWKQMRGVDAHINRSKMEFRNMQISNHQYFGKGFPQFAKEVGNP